MFVFSIELQIYEECTACGKTTYLRCVYILHSTIRTKQTWKTIMFIDTYRLEEVNMWTYIQMLLLIEKHFVFL